MTDREHFQRVSKDRNIDTARLKRNAVQIDRANLGRSFCDL